MCWEPNSGPLEKQQGLLTTETTLQHQKLGVLVEKTLGVSLLALRNQLRSSMMCTVIALWESRQVACSDSLTMILRGTHLQATHSSFLTISCLPWARTGLAWGPTHEKLWSVGRVKWKQTRNLEIPRSGGRSRWTLMEGCEAGCLAGGHGGQQ